MFMLEKLFLILISAIFLISSSAALDSIDVSVSPDTDQHSLMTGHQSVLIQFTPEKEISDFESEIRSNSQSLEIRDAEFYGEDQVLSLNHVNPNVVEIESEDRLIAGSTYIVSLDVFVSSESEESVDLVAVSGDSSDTFSFQLQSLENYGSNIEMEMSEVAGTSSQLSDYHISIGENLHNENERLRESVDAKMTKAMNLYQNEMTKEVVFTGASYAGRVSTGTRAVDFFKESEGAYQSLETGNDYYSKMSRLGSKMMSESTEYAFGEDHDLMLREDLKKLKRLHQEEREAWKSRDYQKVIKTAEEELELLNCLNGGSYSNKCLNNGIKYINDEVNSAAEVEIKNSHRKSIREFVESEIRRVNESVLPLARKPDPEIKLESSRYRVGRKVSQLKSGEEANFKISVKNSLEAGKSDLGYLSFSTSDNLKINGVNELNGENIRVLRFDQGETVNSKQGEVVLEKNLVEVISPYNSGEEKTFEINVEKTSDGEANLVYRAALRNPIGDKNYARFPAEGEEGQQGWPVYRISEKNRPQPNIEYSPSNPKAGQRVAFTAEETVLENLTWDIKNDNQIDGEGLKTSYIFDEPGRFEVELTGDGENEELTYSENIDVSESEVIGGDFDPDGIEKRTGSFNIPGPASSEVQWTQGVANFPDTDLNHYSLDEDTVYALKEGKIIAFDLSGEELWRESLGNWNSGKTISTDGNQIFIGARGHIASYNDRGERLWWTARPDGGCSYEPKYCVQNPGSLIPTENSVYTYAELEISPKHDSYSDYKNGNAIIRLDKASGSVVEYNFIEGDNNENIDFFGAYDSERLIYTSGKTIRSFDKNTSLEWSYTASDDILDYPVLAKDKVLVKTSSKLVALENGEEQWGLDINSKASPAFNGSIIFAPYKNRGAFYGIKRINLEGSVLQETNTEDFRVRLHGSTVNLPKPIVDSRNRVYLPTSEGIQGFTDYGTTIFKPAYDNLPADNRLIPVSEGKVLEAGNKLRMIGNGSTEFQGEKEKNLPEPSIYTNSETRVDEEITFRVNMTESDFLLSEKWIVDGEEYQTDTANLDIRFNRTGRKKVVLKYESSENKLKNVSKSFYINEKSSQKNSEKEISECTNINEQGTWKITSDISVEDSNSCIQIYSKNVTLKGQDHTLNGNGARTGISIDKENVRIENLNIENFNTGLRNTFEEKKLTRKSITAEISPEDDLEQFFDQIDALYQERIYSNDPLAEQIVNPPALKDSKQAVKAVDLELESNKEGVYTRDGLKIESSNIEENNEGLTIDGNKNNILSNEITNNNVGITDLADSGSQNKIKDNEISANSKSGLNLESDYTIASNKIIENGENGLEINSRNKIENNEISRNSENGIIIVGKENEIESDEIRNNQEKGIQSTPSNSNSNMISNVTLVKNGVLLDSNSVLENSEILNDGIQIRGGELSNSIIRNGSVGIRAENAHIVGNNIEGPINIQNSKDSRITDNNVSYPNHYDRIAVENSTGIVLENNDIELAQKKVDGEIFIMGDHYELGRGAGVEVRERRVGKDINISGNAIEVRFSRRQQESEWLEGAKGFKTLNPIIEIETSRGSSELKLSISEVNKTSNNLSLFKYSNENWNIVENSSEGRVELKDKFDSKSKDHTYILAEKKEWYNNTNNSLSDVSVNLKHFTYKPTLFWYSNGNKYASNRISVETNRNFTVENDYYFEIENRDTGETVEFDNRESFEMSPDVTTNFYMQEPNGKSVPIPKIFQYSPEQKVINLTEREEKDIFTEDRDSYQVRLYDGEDRLIATTDYTEYVSAYIPRFSHRREGEDIVVSVNGGVMAEDEITPTLKVNDIQKQMVYNEKRDVYSASIDSDRVSSAPVSWSIKFQENPEIPDHYQMMLGSHLYKTEKVEFK